MRQCRASSLSGGKSVVRTLHKAWDFNYADNGVSRGSERGTLFNLFLPSLSCPFSLTAKLPKAMDGVNGEGENAKVQPVVKWLCKEILDFTFNFFTISCRDRVDYHALPYYIIKQVLVACVFFIF